MHHRAGVTLSSRGMRGAWGTLHQSRDRKDSAWQAGLGERWGNLAVPTPHLGRRTSGWIPALRAAMMCTENRTTRFLLFWKQTVSWALMSWECRTLYKLPTIHTALSLMNPTPSHTYLNFKGLGRGDWPQKASPCLSESVAREALFLASHGAFYCSRMLKKKHREIRITVF